MTNTADRRRFFRIHDNVGVTFSVLEADEIPAAQEPEAKPVDALMQLADFNKKIDLLLGQFKVRDPLAAELLEVLDQKINCVVSQLELDSQLTRDLAHRVQEVNISACGMGLYTDEQLPAETLLKLELLLLPGRFFIYGYGVVVSSEPQTGNDEASQPYYTRIDFRGLSSADQETLIQHIVKRQSAQIKASKDLASLS
ncbi:hypothetical protein HBA55_05990 [Pseudomaricurvus alkylphenolicus]|jgi:hypothetical protein|uniref:hypothetical protein n=1 Tax=Pseudomaricurvus alkylphenolicus TaxID=1306991 RepID=UPI00141E6754|nr:hypothetical protein [Pseudomaricurvus alkylphenolicus]NIB39126.1 hypothetical protein [Pseudomaricurvus alkylphenolicus]